MAETILQTMDRGALFPAGRTPGNEAAENDLERALRTPETMPLTDRQREAMFTKPVLDTVEAVRRYQNLSAKDLPDTLEKFRRAVNKQSAKIRMAEILVRDRYLLEMYRRRGEMSDVQAQTYRDLLSGLQIGKEAVRLRRSAAFRSFVENLTEEQYESFFRSHNVCSVLTHGDAAFEALRCRAEGTFGSEPEGSGDEARDVRDWPVL